MTQHDYTSEAYVYEPTTDAAETRKKQLTAQYHSMRYSYREQAGVFT